MENPRAQRHGMLLDRKLIPNKSPIYLRPIPLFPSFFVFFFFFLRSKCAQSALKMRAACYRVADKKKRDEAFPLLLGECPGSYPR